MLLARGHSSPVIRATPDVDYCGAKTFSSIDVTELHPHGNTLALYPMDNEKLYVPPPSVPVSNIYK